MDELARLVGQVTDDFSDLLAEIDGYSKMLLDCNALPCDCTSDLLEIDKAIGQATAFAQKLFHCGTPQVGKCEHIELNTLPAPQQSGAGMSGNRPSQSSRPWVTVRVTTKGGGWYGQLQARDFQPLIGTSPADRDGFATAGLVRGLGGIVRMDDQPEHHSTINISLPRASTPTAPEAPIETTSDLPAGQKTILIVDDADDIRTMTGRILAMNGYDVLESATGAEALEQVSGAGQPVNLLITDVSMPGMSGRQLADALAAMQPGLRILFISGYSGGDLEDVHVRGPCEAFLQKPFLPQVLLRAVRDLLAQSQ